MSAARAAETRRAGAARLSGGRHAVLDIVSGRKEADE